MHMHGQRDRLTGCSSSLYSRLGRSLAPVCLHLQQALCLQVETNNINYMAHVITYCNAISACEKSLQWQQALSLLPEMRSVMAPPNVIAYEAAISACEKGSAVSRQRDPLLHDKNTKHVHTCACRMLACSCMYWMLECIFSRLSRISFCF